MQSCRPYAMRLLIPFLTTNSGFMSCLQQLATRVRPSIQTNSCAQMRRRDCFTLVGFILYFLVVLTYGVTGNTGGASSSTTGELDNEARLLVQKQLHNKYVVESMDVVLKYSIFNIGGVTATNVILKELSVGANDFEIIGETEVNLGRIPPDGNTTHTIIIKPLKFGYFNFTSAVVSYSSGENTQEVHQVYSSEPGEGYVAPFREFDKRFSPHFLDWAAFAIMSIPPLFIPFMLWHSSKSKYEAVMSAKKAK